MRLIAIAAGLLMAAAVAGAYTSEQAKRGKGIYTEQCALCHLDDLSGDQLYNPGPELAGKVFRARWKGRPVSELFAVIKTTMPYTMPGTLDDRDVVELIAFIFETNTFPPGTTELQADLEALAKMRVPGGD
jgi:cytochrome c